nr:autophagy protein 9A [Hymenolepis microstoma]
MPRVDRTQYELLLDDEIPYNNEEAERVPPYSIQLDHTHNLDLFFKQIYEYHQNGGFFVILMDRVLSIVKFAFLLFLIVQITSCVKWGTIINSNATINSWDDALTPPAVCWASLPWFTGLFVFLGVVSCLVYIVREAIRLSQLWGVRRFCSITLDMPTSDSELNDLTWSDVLKCLINVQTQMHLCQSNKILDQLDIYNRILRRENYVLAMFNRDVFPYRFHAPFFSLPYVYLPRYYLFLLEQLLFGYKSPFETYWQLKPEYKFLGKRIELADEFALHSRILGAVCLVLSPIVFLVQILLFLFSNSQRLRFDPAQLAGRTWSNYARLYLRHFNELPHELNLRLNAAYKTASEYLDCFQSRFLSTLASHLIFTLGGLSLLMFCAGAIKEEFLHLPGYLAVMAFGGLVVKVVMGLIPSEDVYHVPRFPLSSTLAIIHYMPDKWLNNAHTSQVRAEFSQLFQYRFVAAIEEILSPFIVPIILLFGIPKRSLDIVDFLRNCTVEIDGVGDICSYAQLELSRHGDPDWYPSDDLPSPGGSDEVSGGGRQITAVGGKTELSIAHFYSINPTWNLSSANRKFIDDLQKQLIDMQRTQADVMLGLPTTSSMRSLHNRVDPKVAMVMSIHAEGENRPFPMKNVSHIPASMIPTSYSAGCESELKSTSPTSQTGPGTPAEMSPSTYRQVSEKPGPSKFSNQPPVGPSFSLYHPYMMYQPYTSQMDDRTTMATSLGEGGTASLSFGETHIDMDTSSLYMHAIHQRRLRQAQTSSTLLHSLRQRSFTSDGLQDEIRYQQPTHRHLFRGRGLPSGISVPSSIRSVRQFEGVVEEAEEESSSATGTQQLAATGSESSSGTITMPAPRIVSDDVQKWPGLPPPTC